MKFDDFKVALSKESAELSSSAANYRMGKLLAENRERYELTLADVADILGNKKGLSVASLSRKENTWKAFSPAASMARLSNLPYSTLARLSSQVLAGKLSATIVIADLERAMDTGDLYSFNVRYGLSATPKDSGGGGDQPPKVKEIIKERLVENPFHKRVFSKLAALYYLSGSEEEVAEQIIQVSEELLNELAKEGK